MNSLLQRDLTQTDDLLQRVKDFSASFLSGIDTLPVRREQSSYAGFNLPEHGLGADNAFTKFRERFETHLAGNAGARYWGFVTGGTTTAALAGDWLTSVLDMNAADKDGPAYQVEIDALTMLRQLLGLPDTFFGCFTSGATMSNFSGLAIARQWLGVQLGVDVAQEGMGALSSAKILSCVPHSSTVKSMAMLGFGRNALVQLPALPDRESVDIEALKNYLEEHKGEPVIFVASAGTVNTVDYDNLEAIVALKKQYGFYLHVDAAFGAFAACHPDYRHLLKGWEWADSITVDAHKWLNVPYDAAMIFTRHPSLQLESFKNAGAAYLGDPAKDFKFSHYTPENSRRLRALPAWSSLVAYGADGYADIIGNNIRLSKQLGDLIDKSDNFRLLAPVRLCGVCFTTKDPSAVDEFLAALSARGIVFMTSTVYQGVPGIRAALVNWRTTEQDVEIAWEEMQSVYNSMECEKV
ncbi:Glutamate or tyrosine decarboxylase [Chitinophaga sp. CF118]|uniref:pyridoxal phosphate-dependent decarboxylase family protein n=1 Tax=Chitinophaga sp. CF118 TaxID=1884367 RepID=UPI0008E5D4FA|nr:pyridoxal-dependent decarboxylase [Chitinophaga sp. CF118]SFF03414.1 Glutamate or tyrosine decarboxylase [Chitinophaga sp. CF118]